MEVSEFIGLDVGKARTGFARGNSAARLAQALSVVPTAAAVAELKKYEAEGIAGVVVGLPRNLDNEETEQTKWVRRWVESAKQQVKATFYWQDEALSSKLAETAGGAEGSDALAAQIILQDFLDSPQSMRVVC